MGKRKPKIALTLAKAADLNGIIYRKVRLKHHFHPLANNLTLSSSKFMTKLYIRSQGKLWFWFKEHSSGMTC